MVFGKETLQSHLRRMYHSLQINPYLQIRIKFSVENSQNFCVCYGSFRNTEHPTICLRKKLYFESIDNFSPVNTNYLNYDIQRKKLSASLWKIFPFSLDTFKSLMADNKDEGLCECLVASQQNFQLLLLCKTKTVNWIPFL